MVRRKEKYFFKENQMKIGILTFHRAYNYGAVLQCYALQETLKNKGYDVYVIDYKQPAIESNRKIFDLKYLNRNKRHPGNIIRYLLHIPIAMMEHRRIDHFVKKYLRLTAPCHDYDIPTDFDAYIIGSDQLWNFDHTGGMDKVYWGNFKHNKDAKLYTYAVSTKCSCLEFLDDIKLKEVLKRFSFVSLREEDTREMLYDKTGQTVRVDIDPTLLANKNIWDRMINSKWSQRSFLAFYQVGRSGQHKQIVLQHASILAETMGIELIDLSGYKYSPEDFISIIRYAQCVVTTSFHGTAFGLIFQRPLLVYRLNDGNDGRCLNILSMLGLSHCIMDLDQPAKIQKINYSDVANRLKTFQSASFEYIDVIG